MHKKRKNIYYNSDDEPDFYEHFPGKHGTSRKANLRRRCRLGIRRQMADYEEHLWKKRNGWFEDEAYAGLDETPSASKVL